MTESEVVAAVKKKAVAEGGCDGLQSTATLIGPDYPDDPDDGLRDDYLGYWVVGFDDSDCFYVVNDASAEVRFVLVFTD